MLIGFKSWSIYLLAVLGIARQTDTFGLLETETPGKPMGHSYRTQSPSTIVCVVGNVPSQTGSRLTEDRMRHLP